MGSGESTTRKVSFGVDDEDRVRILRGVKLSEDVLQRMRGVANIAPERTSPATTGVPKDTGASHHGSSSSKPQSDTSQSARFSEEDRRRFPKSSQGERETALGKIMSLEREQTRQEAEKTKVLSAKELELKAQQLQKKDSQLRALDAFYKEQLAQLEKRNWEEYEHSKERFHEAVSKTESSVRYHSVDPVCLGLQAQILSCYRENKDQTLTCSNLAKEYMQCINAAKKTEVLCNKAHQLGHERTTAGHLVGFSLAFVASKQWQHYRNSPLCTGPSLCPTVTQSISMNPTSFFSF
ncbi:MICOS complex subunit mic25a-like [Cynoglossus semilaevis]|uniref:MICOS complex subunit mic25a-like n=1 Tax=Cynoglossus semilaevis TaxID=244447 RepID=UPI000D628EDA|nr:MICOS complex subunit mic25a-like [Cynoglossus semilaevis]